jgi:hypothetical protein
MSTRFRRLRLPLSVILFAVAFYPEAVHAAERVTATGKVVDSDGTPIEHAAVLVYSAGVRKGFDLFCPTCYVDCGKRTFTGSDGTYRIAGLSADLVFNLLIVGEGYGASFVNKVDPQKGPRGRVVDLHGNPVRDALVEQQGAIFGQGRSFGSAGWVDLVSVTNGQGEFEIAHTKRSSLPISAMA